MVVRWRQRTLASGEKVLIRRYRRSDIASQCAWPRFENPTESSWNLTLGTPAEMDNYWHTRCRGPNYVRFAVDSVDGRMIGFLSLREIDRREKVARVGIGLSAEFVGQGYGTDALRAFLGYYFERIGFRRIVLDVGAVNERAVRCYRKCGFIETGEHFAPCYPRGAAPTIADATSRYYVRRRNRWWMRMIDMELTGDAWRAQCGGGEHSL